MSVNKSLVVVSLTILSGCAHVRNCCTSVSPRYQEEQIVTKNKYKIVKDSRTGNYDELYHINKSLQHCQPGVFALNGIPIQLRGRAFETKRLEELDNITFLLSAWSCWVMPMYSYTSETRTFSIITERNQSLSPVIVKSQEEMCLSLLLPTAPFLSWIWMDWTWPDSESEWAVDHTVGFWGSSRVSFPKEKEKALAYALAVRLKEFEDTGKDVATILKETSRVDEVTGKIVLPQYKLKDWHKQGDSYFFNLDVPTYDVITAAKIKAIQKDFGKIVLDWFFTDEPQINRNDAHVAYSKFDYSRGRVEGEARVLILALEVESSYYDSFTGRGKIVVRISEKQQSFAREWLRHNIAEIARDKNIRLTAEAITDDAAFYLGSEKYENGILEMEFKVK